MRHEVTEFNRIHCIFRFLDNVEQAIHSPNSPIWDVNFRPLLPAHAQTGRHNSAGSGPTPAAAAATAIATSSSGSGQPGTHITVPAVASTAAASSRVMPAVAATPTSAVTAVQPERVESASEAMEEGESYQEYPSASAAIGSAQVSRTVTQMETSSADPISEIPLVTENGDLPLDLVKAMFRDLDASQRKGDGDVRFIFQSYTVSFKYLIPFCNY